MIAKQNQNHPTSAEVKLSDVIKLILQFLQENNLHQSFQTLQRQSKTCLNFADKALVQSIIMSSNWERMFKLLNQVTLSQETLFDLFELIIDDLIDKDSFEAAKFVLAQCINSSEIYGNFTVNKSIIEQNRQKILRLQYICENPNQKAMYHKPPTQIRRQNIISRIIKQTHQQVQKSRLLTLITSALRYESSKGLIMPNLAYSLIDGKYKNIQNQMEQMITKVDKILKYNEQSRITAVRMSNKGQFIALGGIDGLIQIYQPIQYSLDTSTLKYQGQGIMLYHDNSIQHMIFNQTDEILATTDNKNIIKIWNTYTGRLLRKIDHSSTIGCICWGIDSSQLVLGYQNVQVYGIRGCNLLKEYVCGRENNNTSQQYLIELAVSTSSISGNRVFTFGQTGTIRAFNYKTQQQSGSVNINKNIVNSNSMTTGDIIKVVSTTDRDNQLIFHICTNRFVFTINEKLEQISKYEVNGSGDSIQLVNIVISQKFIYECIKKDKGISKQKNSKNDGQYVIQVRDNKNYRILYSKQIQFRVNIMELHKNRNLLVTYGVDEVLSFWRP